MQTIEELQSMKLIDDAIEAAFAKAHKEAGTINGHVTPEQVGRMNYLKFEMAKVLREQVNQNVFFDVTVRLSCKDYNIVAGYVHCNVKENPTPDDIKAEVEDIVRTKLSSIN